MPSITIKMTVEDKDFTTDQLIQIINTFYDQLQNDRMITDFPEVQLEITNINA